MSRGGVGFVLPSLFVQPLQRLVPLRARMLNREVAFAARLVNVRALVCAFTTTCAPNT
ncbi:MAG: hypothetical protein OXG17_07715 [Chloroflexi bacterium]|nr:hypothetical protein [Chloroflexota bacterium]